MDEFTYDIKREFADDLHNHENGRQAWNVYHEGETNIIDKSIKAQFPDYLGCRAASENMTFRFISPLSVDDLTTLNTIISNHKAIDDFPEIDQNA